MTRLALACSILIVPACAARGPSPQVLAERGKADTLLRQGCYTCLKEAQSIYERLSAPPRPAPGAAQGAFDAALLIAIREKELGLPSQVSMDRAREASARLAPTVPPGLSPSVLLDAAGLVIGETSGFDPEQRAQFTGRARSALAPENPQRRALDPAIESNLVAEYLALAIDCEQTRLRDTVSAAAILARREDVPLIRFRLAICPRPGVPAAASIRETDPRFADTLPWEARRAMVGSQTEALDLYKAVALLGQAREAFPASWAITMSWSQTNQSIAEFESALSGFDVVLADSPAHRDALLGRVTSLSYLLRHDDAIATATKLIDLGMWHIGDAHYWRAWNHYNLKALEPAWADVEIATKLLSNSNVYMLAGLIAYGRMDLPTALQRFDHSFVIDSSNCDAVWMSGLVNVDRQEWEPASPKFSRGMTCFTSAAARARDDLKNLEAGIARRGGPSDPPTPRDLRDVRQRAKLRRDAEIGDERAAQSAFNAAQGFARLGKKSLALNHADAAAAHPRMKEKAEALKAAIEKMQ
jgi:tetratricopeptide (TPR) repeat protein